MDALDSIFFLCVYIYRRGYVSPALSSRNVMVSPAGIYLEAG